MEIKRTQYEKEVIAFVENTKDDKDLGKLIREWYLKNKSDLEYETPEGFRESDYTDEQRYSDFKKGLTFGMK